MNRLADLSKRLESFSERVCIEHEGTSYTYARLLEEIAYWRSQFNGLKVVRGSIVAVQADYSVWSVAALLALFERGSIAALIPREGNFPNYLKEARAEALLKIDVAGSYEWRLHPAMTPHPLQECLRGAGEPGVVLFTSGSTGRPKAAIQRLESFLHKFQKRGRSMKTLAFLLFDHVGGLDTLFYTLSNGGSLLITRGRNPESVLRLIETRGVEILPASPSFLRLLCAAGSTGCHDVSSLKIITYGSEPMDHSTLARMNALFPNVKIGQKYGTTETGAPRCVSRSNDSLWVKFDNDDVEIKVLGGVLWLRTPGMIMGYLNAPSPFDDQGWYCTGDLVDCDGEWLRFRGRATEIINVGGLKVSPAEIEDVILEVDLVENVVVQGEPHELLGQVVTARVATRMPLDSREIGKRIRSHCRVRLAPHKVPIKVEVVAAGLVSERHKKQRAAPPTTN